MVEVECVFCAKIAAWDFLEKRQGIVRFEPLNPVADGHMLFVPELHRENAGLDPKLAGKTFAQASQHAYEQGWPYNLITSCGTAATQSVFHLHIHYVPRFKGDGLHLPWTGQIKTEES